jgi:serine/threonine protein kinase
MASSSSNVVGVHYRVGKKIGEGSFGVIFEGTNLLNNQQVAIKFVSSDNVFMLYLSRGLQIVL